MDMSIVSGPERLVQARLPMQPAQSLSREASFRAAQRHSRMVRFLRWFLPVCAALVGSLYLIPSQLTVNIAGNEASIEAVALSPEGLKMINPRIKGRHASQGAYDVRAESAAQSLSNPDIITLTAINADLISDAGEKTVMTAPGAVYDSKAEQMTFNQGVDVVRSSGLKAKLKSAVAYLPKNLIVSKEPVEVRLHDSFIRADSLELFTKDARAVFKGRVYVYLKREQGTQSAPKDAAAAAPAPPE